MECNTPSCIYKARYLIIESKQIKRYCLICIAKIKDKEYAQQIM